MNEKKEIYRNNKLEEYKELRAEIRHFLERRGQTINFAIVISLGVIGIGLELKNHIIFYAAFILVWLLWYEEIRRLQSIIRTAAYIEIIIEKDMEGLSWETLSRRHSNQTNFIQRLIATAIYPVLLLLNGCIGVYVTKSQHPTVSASIIIAILIIEFILMTIIIIKSDKVIRKGKEKEIAEWDDIVSS